MRKLVLIIRHGEKPGAGDVLRRRAQWRRLPAIGARFAAADTKESRRPVATVAYALGLATDDSHTEKEHERLVATVLNKRYDGQVVLICWRYGHVPTLATALGAKEVPAKWPDERFDLVRRLDCGAAGAPTFRILPPLLLHGDRPAG